ncbi:peptide chain release factor N(5)-glutamine methyltransferase [Streptococcus moroccensis]|uniref:peptide chain release factor N(5)-glutamine methyltransferase n=1 Tax=Streptococcus moroccensis TaxID=1451356 RepID=UPI0027D893F9|nr:peptide chain release factor N(5)-glutamine methyltransferase [Streptococcus moroccensis]
MTYGQFIVELESKLQSLGEEAEALKIVFKELKEWTLTDLVTSLREPLTTADRELLLSIFEQLANHIPAQYILGYTYFSEMKLKVDERVLIPRPETEELVELIVRDNAPTPLRVLDLCTGSGAIALALKKACPDWEMVGSDLSADAIAVASENANVQGLAINWLVSDLFDAISGKYDIIVSNPPYIAQEDQGEVGLNVLASEPHLALFADENGYAIYRQIIEQVSDYLKPTGKLYFEIGYKQGQGLVNLLNQHFPQKRVRIIQDQFGQDRMVVMDHVSV